MPIQLHSSLPTVLHLRSSGDFLGAEQVVLELCDALPQCGFSSAICYIVGPNEDAPALIQQAESRGIRTYLLRCRGRLDPRAFLQLRAIVRESSTAILHTHGYKEDFYALCSRSPVPYVATNHLWKKTTTSLKLYASIDGLTLRRFSRVIAVSQEVRDEMAKKGVPASKLVYIPNGIDSDTLVERATTESVADPYSPNASLRAVVIANLTPEKGHETLLHAWREFVTEHPGAELLIVGEGPLHESLQAYCDANGLNESVKFFGRSTTVPALLRHAGVFVLPSLREGLPMAILEAMSIGMAIVASEVGEIGEVLDGAEILVPPGEPAPLLNALRNLAASPDRRAELKALAFARVREAYSGRSMAERYADVYRSVLNNGPHTSL